MAGVDVIDARRDGTDEVHSRLREECLVDARNRADDQGIRLSYLCNNPRRGH
jgi:hypothetical protein